MMATGVALLEAGCGPPIAARADPSTSATAGPITAPVRRYLPPACSNAEQLGRWSLPRLAAQLVIVPVNEGDVAVVGPEVAQGVGGLILFGSVAPAGLAVALRELEGAAVGGVAPFVMTDEEGGGVQRMANLVGQMPWARQMAEAMSPAAVEALAKSVGARMRRAGVTMDLGPVADVDGGSGPDATDADGWRSFSADPRVAATYALAFAKGLEAAGVIPVVKHFPGLGGATGNPDLGPAATQPYSALKRSGLTPFRAAVAAGLPVVMVANATVPGLTDQPASLSAVVIEGLLRQQMGFSGLVVTDSLSAGAIQAQHLTVPQAAVRAIAAGADMVMFNSPDPDRLLHEIEMALVDAVANGSVMRGTLVAAAVQVLSTKGVDLCLPPALVRGGGG